MKFSQDEFFDRTTPFEIETSGLTSESLRRSFGRRKWDASYDVRVLWERTIVAVDALSTMWEEVHRKDHLGPFGFHYRCADGAYWNRLADYHALGQSGTGQVLILKVAEEVHGAEVDCRSSQQGEKRGESRLNSRITTPEPLPRGGRQTLRVTLLGERVARLSSKTYALRWGMQERPLVCVRRNPKDSGQHTRGRDVIEVALRAHGAQGITALVTGAEGAHYFIHEDCGTVSGVGCDGSES
jgi:hypothetical protein